MNEREREGLKGNKSERNFKQNNKIGKNILLRGEGKRPQKDGH